MQNHEAPTINVVVVDDHEMVRKGIVSWLSDEADIVVVGQGRDYKSGLDAIQSKKPHVAIIDMHLADEQLGIDIVKTLRGASNLTPVLMISGLDALSARACLDAGANGFLTKEDSREHYVDAVRGAASDTGQTYVSPSVIYELQALDRDLRDAEITELDLAILAHIELTNAEISRILAVADGTVRNHISRLYEKTGTGSRIELRSWALGHRLIQRQAP
jgi:NarL family two-component system response regulator LiaR